MHGSQMIYLGSLVFHRWFPLSGMKMDTGWWSSFWIRLRAFPFHLWKEDVFATIAEKCGGLRRVDENTSSLKDLRWARIQTLKTDFRKIPGWCSCRMESLDTMCTL